MLKNRFFIGIAALAVFVTGIQANALAFGNSHRQATFKVRIENISNAEGLETDGGMKYPFALSPGLFVVNHKKQYFFEDGDKATAALEAQAEDGNPELLSKHLLTKVGSVYMGTFNTPMGAAMPGPLLPGGSYEFSFTAQRGMRLNIIAMFGQSNDLFFAPSNALDLFDSDGKPLSGDITQSFLLWDAGTEVNQAPGIGDQQAPRQAKANTGTAENGVVRIVKDSFKYPETKDVLRITITSE